MSLAGEAPVQLRVFAWATPRPGMTLDELVWHLENETTNEVLEIDRENNRVKLMDVTQEGMLG